MITGSCLCGQLSYELDETKTEAQLHCHCRDCQKVTGSGKATIVMLPRENLRLSENTNFIKAGERMARMSQGILPDMRFANADFCGGNPRSRFC